MTNHDLKYHYHPAQGWMNDPNGLVCFGGYYHVFYQHAPHFEQPWHESMVWGHARTKDFLQWEELPVALPADTAYDEGGAWSGTATVKDGTMVLFYASVSKNRCPTISVATSTDGIHFEKNKKNPIISVFPPEGSRDFRDPAVFCENGVNYLVIASADKIRKTGNLLLYRSDNYEDWEYVGVLYEYEDCDCCECPSFVKYKNGYLLSTSVITNHETSFFEVLYGQFDGKSFQAEIISHFQKGPDEYAGQIFHAEDGRDIMISWVSGWHYQDSPCCIGALSLPLELTVQNGKILAYPVKEVRHLLDENDCLVDAYLTERFVNKGEEVHITVTKEEP